MPPPAVVSVLAWQGLQGVLYDAADVAPAPVPSLDLRHMGPMKLSRFWSAVHDALLYADPRAATGGRVSLGPHAAGAACAACATLSKSIVCWGQACMALQGVSRTSASSQRRRQLLLC